jgi:hypothetical protein
MKKITSFLSTMLNFYSSLIYVKVQKKKKKKDLRSSFECIINDQLYAFIPARYFLINQKSRAMFYFQPHGFNAGKEILC